MLFALPFYGFPPVISIVLSVWTKNSLSQIILSEASLLYGVWFAYVMSGLILIFVGPYALPGLLPLWLTACIVERRHRKKNQKSKTEP